MVINNLKKIKFSSSHFLDEVTKKKQIYLHHTAGNGDGEGVFRWWASTPDRVATFAVVSGDGRIIQGFDSDKWAYHLGLGTKHFKPFNLPYINLDKMSVGIEICNWGYLKPRQGKDGVEYVNYVGGVVPDDQVTKLDELYKGYMYWHSYSDAQIESVRLLLLELSKKHGIEIVYNPDIFGLTKRAFEGSPGLYTHNSVRKDKFDIYPCPRMIEMLKSL